MWRQPSCDRRLSCFAQRWLRTKPALRRQQGKSGSGRSCGRRGGQARELMEVLKRCAQLDDGGDHDRAGGRRHALKAQRYAGHHARAGFAGSGLAGGRSVGGRFAGSGFGVMARHVIRHPGHRCRFGRPLHAFHGGGIERRHTDPGDQEDREHPSYERWHGHVGTLSYRRRSAKPPAGAWHHNSERKMAHGLGWRNWPAKEL